MDVWIWVAYVIVVIYLLYALTFYLYYYSQNYDCRTNGNFWCWSDWTCADGSKPAQNLYGCFPNVTRGLDYCTNYVGTPPPGCQCMPINGEFPTGCTYEWNDNLGHCSDLLRATGNNNWPNLTTCSNIPSPTS